MYTLENMFSILFAMIPVGFALGFVPHLFGLGFSGVVKILNSV